MVAQVKSGTRPTDRSPRAESTPRTTIQGTVGWWEGRKFVKASAEVFDLRPGGAKLVAAGMPPRRSTMWLRLASPVEGEWLEADAYRTDRIGDEPPVILLKFRDGCPRQYYERFVGAGE